MSAFYTRPITMIPGGLPFTDPLTPRKKFPGMEVASEDEQIARIIKWRTTNPNIYSDAKWLDFEAVRLELRAYQKQRLGDSKQFFTDGKNSNVGMVIKSKEPSRACECGATEAKPKYCRTCSSARIVGYTCLVCGKDRGV